MSFAVKGAVNEALANLVHFLFVVGVTISIFGVVRLGPTVSLFLHTRAGFCLEKLVQEKANVPHVVIATISDVAEGTASAAESLGPRNAALTPSVPRIGSYTRYNPLIIWLGTTPTPYILVAINLPCGRKSTQTLR